MSNALDTTIPFSRPAYTPDLMNPQPRFSDSGGTKREGPESAILDSVASYVQARFEEHRISKLPIEAEIIDCMRRVDGQYDPVKLSSIREAGLPENFRKLTAQKCRDAEVWMKKILSSAGGRMWKLDPNPLPDLDPEVMQKIQQHCIAKMMVLKNQGANIPDPESYPLMFVDLVDQHIQTLADNVKQMLQEVAGKLCGNMQTKIDDELDKGGWNETINMVIHDMIRLPGGILEGPVIEHRKRTVVQKDAQTGQWNSNVIEEYVPVFERIDPINFFPAPQVEHISDGDIIIRKPTTRQKFASYIGLPGFEDEKVREVLKSYPEGYKLELPIDAQVKLLTSQYVMHNSMKMLDVLQFNGYIPGWELIQWGIDESICPDTDIMYEVEALVVGHITIKVVVNPVRFGSSKFSMSGFHKRSNTCWYHGIPQIMADIQDVANQAARMLGYNMAIGAAPMASVNVDKMAPGEDFTSFYPGRTFATQSNPRNPGDNAKAIEWFETPFVADKLLAIYQAATRDADNVTGIPSFAHGDATVGGGGDTASGLSMLMSAASRGIEDLVVNLLKKIVSNRIESLYQWNMLYVDDDSIKGDATVVITDAISIMAKEQESLRYKDILQVSNNPADAMIIGPKQRAYLYRGWLNGISVDTDKAVKSDDELEGAEQQHQQLQQANVQQAQGAAMQAMSPSQSGAEPPASTTPVAPAAPNRGQIPSTSPTDAAGNPMSGMGNNPMQAGQNQ